MVEQDGDLVCRECAGKSDPHAGSSTVDERMRASLSDWHNRR
jgi:hypothetical protein